MLGIDSEQLLYHDPASGLRLRAAPRYSDGFLALLERAEFGSDGLKYRRLDVRAQLARLRQPLFLELLNERSVVGTYVLAHSRLRRGNDVVDGIYRGLLTLAADARGAGLGRLLVGKTLAWLESRLADVGRTAVTWGCIERDNRPSLQLLQSLGARPLGTLDALTSYRQWPRQRVSVEQPGDSGLDAIRGAFAATHADCLLRTSIDSADRYFALCEQSTIVAGARATPTRVDMLSTGGLWDVAYERLLRHIPAARRRFDPHDFRYLRLTDVVVWPGKEHLWRDFLSTLMAQHGVHMAMFVLDPRSRARKLLQAAGLFGRLTKQTRRQLVIVGGTSNDPAKLLDDLAGAPLAIGPIDI